MPQSISVVIIDSDVDDEKIFHKISPRPFRPSMDGLKRGKYLPLWKRARLPSVGQGMKGDFEARGKVVE